MKSPHCRIGKVTLKGGAELVVFPNDRLNYMTYNIGWGSITFRTFDSAVITRETMVYMLRAIENEIITGEDDE